MDRHITFAVLVKHRTIDKHQLLELYLLRVSAPRSDLALALRYDVMVRGCEHSQLVLNTNVTVIAEPTESCCQICHSTFLFLQSLTLFH